MMTGSGRFPTTSWSIVLGAARGDDWRPAFERLCTIYWPPVYGFVRWQVGDAEWAKDLTQAFFTRLLEHQDLCPAEPGKARFRSFLMASIKHFLANEWDRLGTQRRGGGRAHLQLDFSDPRCAGQESLTDGLTPEKIFEKHWATLMLDRALAATRKRYEESGQRRQFDLLEKFLLGGRDEGRYRAAAENLEMSEAAVKMAVHRLRRRFGDALRREISLTVNGPPEVDDELRYLLSVVAA